MFKIMKVIIVMFAISITGCVGPTQRSLLSANTKYRATSSKSLQISNINVVDNRPGEEIIGISPEVRYVVPFLILNWWATEGNVMPEASLYSLNFQNEMSQLIDKSLKSSGLITGNSGAKISLNIKMDHLYGVTRMSSFAMVGAGGGVTEVNTFAPYGFVSGEIDVVEDGGKAIGKRKITGYFDPKLLDTFQVHGAAKNTLTAAALEATSSFADNVVKALEQLLSEYQSTRKLPVDKSSTFFIGRPTNDGLFMEVAGVNIDTGEILSDVIMPKSMEPFSGLDEWVLLPYFAGEHLMTQQEYSILFNRLQSKYDVRYVHNVRVAHFFGNKIALNK